MLRAWHALTYLGDGAVLVPCALLLFAWLIAIPASRRTGWLWLAAVVLVSGGVVLSKVLYMVTGWHPAHWNFIGLSGHAALSWLFWPAAGALLTTRNRAAVRVVAIASGACLALAIATSSWVLRDHSLAEVAAGALWGALVATAFIALAWRETMHAPSRRTWLIGPMLLVAAVMFRHEFPSRRVLGWIAEHATGRTAFYTRSDLGPQASLSKDKAPCEGESACPKASPRPDPARHER